MNRREPMRRTELKRGTKPLQRTEIKRGGSALRRTRLRPVSSKRAAENRQRAKVLAPVREAQQWCARCGRSGVGLDGHELLRRSAGGSITDLANIVLVCRRCHDWIGLNSAAATAEGWDLSRKHGAA